MSYPPICTWLHLSPLSTLHRLSLSSLWYPSSITPYMSKNEPAISYSILTRGGKRSLIGIEFYIIEESSLPSLNELRIICRKIWLLDVFSLADHDFCIRGRKTYIFLDVNSFTFREVPVVIAEPGNTALLVRPPILQWFPAAQQSPPISS